MVESGENVGEFLKLGCSHDETDWIVKGGMLCCFVEIDSFCCISNGFGGSDHEVWDGA